MELAQIITDLNAVSLTDEYAQTANRQIKSSQSLVSLIQEALQKESVALEFLFEAQNDPSHLKKVLEVLTQHQVTIHHNNDRYYLKGVFPIIDFYEIPDWIWLMNQLAQTQQAIFRGWSCPEYAR